MKRDAGDSGEEKTMKIPIPDRHPGRSEAQTRDGACSFKMEAQHLPKPWPGSGAGLTAGAGSIKHLPLHLHHPLTHEKLRNRRKAFAMDGAGAEACKGG